MDDPRSALPFILKLPSCAGVSRSQGKFTELSIEQLLFASHNPEPPPLECPSSHIALDALEALEIIGREKERSSGALSCVRWMSGGEFHFSLFLTLLLLFSL